jgi:hypothetical protein
MCTKIILYIVSSLISISIFQELAHSNTTKWEDAQMSLSQLLDSGWQVAGHGTNRVAANSNAGNGFDVKTYSFLLTKNGKYVICIIENPGPPQATDKCRKLN